MICPNCKIGKLYWKSSNKDGSIKKVKCIICKKDFDFKKLHKGNKK